VIKPIQIPSEVAAYVANGIQSSERDAERQRTQTLERLEHRRQAVLAKLDRGYEDFVERRISAEFWARKSQAWEAELAVIDAEKMRVEVPPRPIIVTVQKILELAKQAENLYKSQNPGEQRRLLETVLSNCTFNHGTLCPTYGKPFDLFVRGNKTGDWLLRLDSNQQPSG
jgi:site-specific DNA recombinase